MRPPGGFGLALFLYLAVARHCDRQIHELAAERQLRALVLLGCVITGLDPVIFSYREADGRVFARP
jgi:hypothetical protein